jgi:hypothetical protein
MELWRALASLVEPPTPALRPVAEAVGLSTLPGLDEHTDVIVFQAYPYASVYLGPEGMMGGDARDRIAGFWRALGAEPGAEPDHLGAVLAGLADLADAERDAAGARVARHALFWEHVASWMPPYLAMLHRVGGDFHRRWAELAAAALAEEAASLGAPARLPAHLRAAAPFGDPETPEEIDELIAVLLAPVRVGFTLGRDDLVRAADDLGLGCRVGERRYVLRSLLAQDAAGALGWLAAEARRQADALDAVALPPISTWWATRARATAARLDRWSGWVSAAG